MQGSINEIEFDPDLLEYLVRFITDHKKSAIEKALSNRTSHLKVVLEDIFNPHNASIVIRTRDCFGLQDVHIVEKIDQYKVNPFVTRGASKWVGLHKYFKTGTNSVDTCFASLRDKG